MNHDLSICEDFLDDGVWSECSCGWSGKRHVDKADAIEEWENHCDVAFMESTMESE